MLKNYIKIALKVLGRNRFFTFVSLFGISFTLAILLVVTTFLDFTLNSKYPDIDRKKYLFVDRVTMQDAERESMSRSSASFYFLDRYVKKMQTPELVSLHSNNNRTNTFVGDKKLKISLRYTCENFWKMYQFEFLEGRPYQLQEIEDNAFVTVITQGTAEQYFGEGVSPLGKNIVTDNTTFRVIGVVKDVPAIHPLGLTNMFAPYNTSKSNLQDKSFLGGFQGVLLTRNKRHQEEIKAEFDNMVNRIEIPKDEYYTILEVSADTFMESLTRDFFYSEKPQPSLFFGLIFGAMLLFMLLPALNLINLNTSRIMERASEIGVRKAFGATSSTLTIQFLVENIILTFVGGLFGLILAFIILKTIEASGIIPYAQLSLNYKVFFVGIILCVFFGLLSGVLPALRMSRMQIVNAIKGGEL